MLEALWIPLLLVTLSALFLVVSGLKRQPGIGIILTLILVVIALWQRWITFAQLGLSAPENWLTTILLGLTIGCALAVLSIALLEPWVERITGEPHDVSVVDSVRGSWKALLSWLVVVWVLVAFLEEFLYRGFLMTEIIKIIGAGWIPTVINISITSLIFGFSHGYQGKSGIITTGIVGAVIAVIYVLNGYNLWLPIFVHGFIDTAALVLMSVGADKSLRTLFWREGDEKDEISEE